MPVLDQVAVNDLQAHPRNSSIYGDEDVTYLVELISHSGWVKPLVCTSHNVIISGHRRWKTAQILGWETIPVEYRDFFNKTAELEALLLENATRTKSAEQKVREGFAWSDIETEKAKERQRIAARETNQKLGRDVDQTLPENFPGALKGETRDVIAHRIGLGSGRTYQKAAEVVGVIDENTKKGDLLTAQGLRKILNEQSVDAAHRLLKKTPQERQAIANLITSGKAKTTRQAVKMLNKNNDEASSNENSNDPSQPNLAGFSIGDWVEVRENAYPLNLTYIGRRGRVEQILAAEQQISVAIQGVDDKVRFSPDELSLLVRAAPQNPVHIGDIVFVRIECHEAASHQDKKWNGFWGKVMKIGELGSLTVDVGKESLQLFSRDLKLIDTPSNELTQVVDRVLCLRRLEIEEFEQGLLDMLQRREWFSPRQLHYLKIVESFYLYADSHKAEQHHLVQFRGR